MDNINDEVQTVIKKYKDNAYSIYTLPKSDKKYATSYKISVIENIIYQKIVCAGIKNYDNTGWFNSLFQFILCMSNFVYSILNITETLIDNVNNNQFNTNPNEKYNPYKMNITESQHIMKHIFRKQLLIHTEYSSGVLTKEDIHTCFEVLNFNCKRTEEITEYNKQQEVANKLNRMLNIFNAKEDDNYIYNTDCFIFNSAPRQLLDKKHLTSYSNILTVLIEPSIINDTISELITKLLTEATQKISKLSTYLIIELRLKNTDIPNVTAIQIPDIRKVDYNLELGGLNYYLSGFICYINEATNGKEDYIFYKIISVNDDVDFIYICYYNDIIYSTQQFDIGGNNITITIPIIDTYKLTYDNNNIITIVNKNIRPNILLYTQSIEFEKKQRGDYITKVKDEQKKQEKIKYNAAITSIKANIEKNKLYEYKKLKPDELQTITTTTLNNKTNPRRGIDNNKNACFFNSMLQFVLYMPEFVLSILNMDNKATQNDDENTKNLIRNILLKHLTQSTDLLSLDDLWAVILQLFKKDILKDENTDKDIPRKNILHAQQDSDEALRTLLNFFPDYSDSYSFNKTTTKTYDISYNSIKSVHEPEIIIIIKNINDINNTDLIETECNTIITVPEPDFRGYYIIANIDYNDNQNAIDSIQYNINMNDFGYQYYGVKITKDILEKIKCTMHEDFNKDAFDNILINDIDNLFLRKTQNKKTPTDTTYNIVIKYQETVQYKDFKKYIIVNLLLSINEENTTRKILQQPPLKYKLIIGNTPYILSGFIVHIGPSLNSGHYIFYKMTSHNNYILYNDDFVCTRDDMDTKGKAFPNLKLQCSDKNDNTFISIIKEKKEKKYNEGNEGNEGNEDNDITPYILLYEKQTPQSQSNNITNKKKKNNNNNTRNNFSFNLTFNDILGL